MFRFLTGFLCLFFLYGAANAATLTVTKTADTNDGVCNADCSLREAIDVAASGDTIAFSSLFNTTQFIVLDGTELFINKSLTINGTGADKISVSGSNRSRVFNISGAGITVNISSLRISDGDQVPNGGGIWIQSGNVNLDKVSVSFNFVTSAAANVFGGGIDNEGGVLTITNSLISGNFALTSATGNGGGIQNGRIFTPATLNLTNTTISGNSIIGAAGNGGGINNARSLNMTHVTIAQNEASGVAGLNNGFFSSTSIANTIIAKNQGNRDVFGNFISSGFNLIGDGSGSTNLNQPTDQVGTNAAPIDPLLAPLGNNSGTTMTHALQTGSPAIDKGNSFAITNDQRGQNRPVDNATVANAVGGDASDIGAFETLAPSAAGAEIRGRVVSGKNRPVRFATVTLTDMQGNTRYARTNPFGYFNFEEIEVGETYIITARAKGFEFSNQVIAFDDSIGSLIIMAN